MGFLEILRERFRQKHRTLEFPAAPAMLPGKFRGRPVLDPARCDNACQACVEVCPSGALQREKSGPALDLGRCVFCPECVSACPSKALSFSPDVSLAATKRSDLVLRGEKYERTVALGAELRKLFGRSLKLRQVSAGGCNGCEGELVALGNVVFDVGRLGVQFVASPRHADGMVVTGPVTPNMMLALRETWKAIPAPKLVIAVGACAISGGVFRENHAKNSGVPEDLPVDLYIPGCPPHPLTLLDGLVRWLGRVSASK